MTNGLFKKKLWDKLHYLIPLLSHECGTSKNLYNIDNNDKTI